MKTKIENLRMFLNLIEVDLDCHIDWLAGLKHDFEQCEEIKERIEQIEESTTALGELIIALNDDAKEMRDDID